MELKAVTDLLNDDTVWGNGVTNGYAVFTKDALLAQKVIGACREIITPKAWRLLTSIGNHPGVVLAGAFSASVLRTVVCSGEGREDDVARMQEIAEVWQYRQIMIEDAELALYNAPSEAPLEPPEVFDLSSIEFDIPYMASEYSTDQTDSVLLTQFRENDTCFRFIDVNLTWNGDYGVSLISNFDFAVTRVAICLDEEGISLSREALWSAVNLSIKVPKSLSTVVTHTINQTSDGGEMCGNFPHLLLFMAPFNLKRLTNVVSRCVCPKLPIELAEKVALSSFRRDVFHTVTLHRYIELYFAWLWDRQVREDEIIMLWWLSHSEQAERIRDAGPGQEDLFWLISVLFTHPRVKNTVVPCCQCGPSTCSGGDFNYSDVAKCLECTLLAYQDATVDYIPRWGREIVRAMLGVTDQGHSIDVSGFCPGPFIPPDVINKIGVYESSGYKLVYTEDLEFTSFQSTVNPLSTKPAFQVL